jgi:isocitrate dehydrogenase (NAD+)
METARTVTLIEGDGIGPDVACAAVEVVAATGTRICWEPVPIGESALQSFGKLLPDSTLESIRRNKVALKGPITTNVGEGFPSINVAIRQTLDLYACLRPIQSIPGVPAVFKDLDIIVVRENTEDLYGGKEHEVIPGVVESIKVITEKASTRIAEFAFHYAKTYGRHKVTAVHKANIMKLSDGLFLQCARDVAKGYPDIEYTEMIVDNTCMQMVYNPGQFDILLAPNLYGDILSDLGAGLVGGLGIVPGANLGVDMAVFEAVHGSWPEAAGMGIANPTAMVLSAAMLLDFIRESHAADLVRNAVTNVHAKGETQTPDLGGTASTHEFTQALVREIIANR